RYQSAKEFLQAFCEAASTKPPAYLKTLEKVSTDDISGEKLAQKADKSDLVVKPANVIPAFKYILAIIILGVVASMATVLYIKNRPPIEIPPQQPIKTPINPIGDNFVLIPGGTCTIGRDPEECQSLFPGCKITSDETPPHTVKLAPYYLSKYELTNKEYR